MSDYYRYAITRDAEEFVQGVVDSSMDVTATVVKSANPRIEVDDTSKFRIRKENRSEADIAKALQDCPGPKRGVLARVLGQKGVCRAVTRAG